MKAFIGTVLLTILLTVTVTTARMTSLAAERKVNSCERGCTGSGQIRWRCICDCMAQKNDGFPCHLERDPNGKFWCACE